MNTEELLTQILTELRASHAVLCDIRALLQQQPTDDNGPNFQRSINEYPTFDWSTIDAEVIAHDRNGATVVTWHGQEYTRRRHVDFNNAVWFSRYTGKMENDKKIYARLVTFSDTKRPAKSLPDEITDLLPDPDPKPTPSTPARLARITTPAPVRSTIDPQLAYWNLVKQHKASIPQGTLQFLASVANNDGYEVALHQLQGIIATLTTPQATPGDASAPSLGEHTANPLDDLLSDDSVDAFFQ